MASAGVALMLQLVGPFGLLGGALLNEIGIPVSTGIIGGLLGIGKKKNKPSDVQQTIREDVASRTRGYGITHVGGVLSFIESKDGTLYVLTTHHQGQLAEIIEHRLNDKEVTLDGAGVVQGASFRDAISILTRLGTADQTAYSELTSVFPAFTTDHRQRGCANTLLICREVKQKHFGEVYEGSQIPSYTQIRKNSLIYDPRLDSTQIIGYDLDDNPIMGSGAHRTNDESTWEWSANAALVIADYAAHPDGYGMGMDNINWTNIAAEADVCDEEVTTIDATTIPRYRLYGEYALSDEDRKSVLGQLMEACDGFYFLDAELKFNLVVGRWIEPTVHITDDHIISLAASKGLKGTRQVNEAKVIYTDDRFSYREQEAAPIIDLASQALIGPVKQKFERYWVPHHNQASRLGKLIVLRAGSRWHITMVTNLFGLNLLGERFCYLTVSELNIVELAFQIAGITIRLQDNTVEVSLDQVMESDWDFNAAVEEGTPPQVPGTTYTEPSIPVPTGLVLTEITFGTGTAIRAEVNPPTREGLYTIFEYKQTAEPTWLRMVVNDDEYVGQSGNVVTGVEYEVRARHYALSGRESDNTAVETITPVGDEVIIDGGDGA